MFGNSFSLSSLICLFFLFSASFSWGQSSGICGSSLLFKPENAAQRQLFDNDMYTRAVSRSGEDTTHYTLPLAVHIVHQDGQENISDIDVFAAIDLLNKAFRNQIPFDPASGADLNIDFCLSPSAIKRYKSPLTNVMLETQDDALKQVGFWDSRKYINIWIVKSISSVTHGSAVAGYATMPFSHGLQSDGIVVEARFMNNNPDDVKVLIHEMGHYLGLYHTFENGCGNNDCLLDGDRVCDTPPDQSTANVLCTSSANTCQTDSDDPSVNNPFRSTALGGLGDQPDQFQNYMDYGYRSCQNRFTTGQRTRMRNALLGERTSLVNSPGTCIGCDTPISITLNIPDTLPAGMPYTFSLNPNQSGLTYFWILDHVISTTDTATILYPRAGSAELIVFATNPTAPECNVTLRNTIVFTCAVPEPIISASTVGPHFSGETATFSTADNGYTYTWFIDGLQVGVGSQLNYTINGTHGRMLTLMAGNGTCQSVSNSFYINPNNCGSNKQNNVWHFGNEVGIDFNTTPPTAIEGSLSASEGCAVICDDNGNVLYSSDGEVVKNAQTGAILTNGSGLTGSYTTTQGALFVPRPGSNRYIYLFTLDFNAGAFGPSLWNGGIYYSVIDMQTNEVTTKNHLLAPSMTEKMTAVRNRTGNGVWVIAHKWDTNEFYAWQVTSTGVSGSPVISSVGSVHAGNEPYYTIGEMKASPSGKKIALTIGRSGKTEVFDFNTSTGQLSNPTTLSTDIIPRTYGVAFSPNERFIYVSSAQGKHQIIRYDLQAGAQADIQASEVLIANEQGNTGAIQLAPDGKIYTCRSGMQYLGVISNPNAANPANCGYNPIGFKILNVNNYGLGLPNPIQSIFENIGPHIIGAEKVCLTGASKTEIYTFEPKQNATYTWIYNGINSHTVLNDSTLEITFTQTGFDTVILKRTTFCGDSFDTLFVTAGPPPTVFDLGPDIIVCKGTAVVLDAGAGMFHYKWSNGVRKQTASFNTAGKVWAEIITPAGCVMSDTLTISHYSLPELDLGQDTSLCGNSSITLTAPSGMDSYLWNTGATTESISADSGEYIITVEKYGCLFSDTFLVVKNIPADIFPNDTIPLCLNITEPISAISGMDSYQWQRPSGAIENTRNITLAEEGWYILDYANLCGSATDSVFFLHPRFIPYDTLVSCADTVRIMLETVDTIRVMTQELLYMNCLEKNGNEWDIYRSATYIATGQHPSHSCFSLQIFTVMVDTALNRPPLSINLGNDTSYCAGGVLPLDAGAGFDSYVWNTGSREAKTTAYGFGDYYVTARYCGYQYTDTITITEESSLVIKTLADTTICPDETVLLDAGDEFEWYEWSTGDTTRQITVVPGQYTVQVGLNSCMTTETVNVSAIPVNYIISGDSLLCVGETITITATQHSGYDILWDSAGVQLAGAGNVLLVSEAGTFRVKNEACPSSDWSVPFVVQEENISAPHFTYTPNTVCVGKPVQISFDDSPYDNFRWDDGSSDNPKTFIAPASPLLTAYGIKCSEDFAPVIQVINDISCYIGIAESESCENAFSLIPNPSTSFVALSVQCDVKSPFSVSVLDYGMKNLGQVRGNLADANLLLNGLLQSLPTGGYVVRVTTEKGIFHLRWIIVK